MKTRLSIKIGSQTLSVGQDVKRQFPKGIDSQFSTCIIEGKVEKIVETTNSAFATIRQADGRLRLVCLG